MKLRWKILIAVDVLLGIGVLLAVVRHYQLRAMTDAYIAQLKAEGEPLDLTQVLPPPVPPEKNSADTLRQAAAVTEADEGWWVTNQVEAMTMVAPGKAMICWQQPDVRCDFTTDSWQEVGAALAKDAEALGQLRQIISKPDFDFQMNYDSGVASLNFTNLNLAEAKYASQRLLMDTVEDLHNGDSANAVQNLRAMLAIAQALRDERLEISELVRIAIAQMALAGNWELLQAPEVTDKQLAELQQSWTNSNFIQSGLNALEMERISGRISLDKWRSSNAQFKHDLILTPEKRAEFDMAPASLWDRVKLGPELFVWRYWWSYEDQLRALKGYEVLTETLRSAQTNDFFEDALENQSNELDELGIAKLDIKFPRLPSEESDFRGMLSESVLTTSAYVKRVMRVEVAREMMITAIALKRHQIKYGKYPPNLNSLVPEFISVVPHDSVDGKPLRYRLNTDGTFLLYSVGENSKDDGGSPALEKGIEGSNFNWLNPHALDWVWPQPATPEEIKDFYAHAPKEN